MSTVRTAAERARDAFLALKDETDPTKRLAMKDSYLAARKFFVDAKNADDRGAFVGYTNTLADENPPTRESIRDLETLECYVMHLMNNFIVLKTLALPPSNFTDLCLSIENGYTPFESPEEFCGFLPTPRSSSLEPALFPRMQVETSVGTIDVYQEEV